jgi:spermidine synthase
MQRSEVVTTRFQSLEIWRSKSATEFRVAGAVHAWHHHRRLLTGLAWDLIAASALLHQTGQPRSILMLGLAGGTAFRIIRHLLPECHLTAVDIDAEIVDLARRHMHLDPDDVEIHIADAYQWLAQNKRSFDLVIDDIYLAGATDVFRPKQWDPLLLSNLRRAIRPGGLLAVNLVTGPGHRGMQSLTRRILRENFPTVRTIRTPGALNEVLVAGESVATAARLRDQLASFPERSDRDHWRKIRLRHI